MASVAEIDGLTISGGAPAVPSPAAAYSVRLLDSAVGISSYTGAAMRVRRVTGTGNTGNDDEADVAFDTSLTEPTISLDSAVSNFSAGGSNATTLGQFLNVGTVGGTTYTDADSLAPNTAAAYVDEWKDQSGNANHATQGTPSNQPQIHSGLASTDLILENGKPIISRVNNSTGFEATAVDMSGSTISVSSVSLATTSASIMVWFGTNLNERLYTGTSGSTLTDGGQAGLTITSAELFWNGSSQGTSATRGEVYTQFTNNQTLASWVGLTNLAGTQFNLSQNVGYWQMHNMQEIIFWESDQSSNRTAIESNVNTYFSIY